MDLAECALYSVEVEVAAVGLENVAPEESSDVEGDLLKNVHASCSYFA